MKKKIRIWKGKLKVIWLILRSKNWIVDTDQGLSINSDPFRAFRHIGMVHNWIQNACAQEDALDEVKELIKP